MENLDASSEAVAPALKIGLGDGEFTERLQNGKLVYAIRYYDLEVYLSILTRVVGFDYRSI